MPRSQRVAQYIQRLAYENLLQPHERDERPLDDDARLREPAPTPNIRRGAPLRFLPTCHSADLPAADQRRRRAPTKRSSLIARLEDLPGLARP